MSDSVSILGGYQSDFADNLAKSGGSVESLVRDTVVAAGFDIARAEAARMEPDQQRQRAFGGFGAKNLGT